MMIFSMENYYKEVDCFAKYLTNQELLELQLSDSNFKLYVSSQLLVILQYLNSAILHNIQPLHGKILGFYLTHA